MNLTETVVDGTIQPDGTLVLDEKLTLPPGKVKIIVRQEVEIILPENDPFWQRMRMMWAISKSREDAGDGGAHSLAEVAALRDEWDEHQQAIERLQGECGLPRQLPKEPKS
jgi:hypothetical protein